MSAAYKSSSVDLTQGSVFGHLLSFAMPILLGQLFQNLYNSVDSIVVGNFVGMTALAAVTSSSDIAQMLVGFFTGLSAGSGVLFSRAFGARDYDTLHDAIHTALAFAMLLGLGMAAAGIVLTPFLLKVVACPPDVWAEALLYLRIYFVGVLFTSIYNVGAGVLRAVGDSRNPFRYLVAASLTNIVLDVLLVAGFGMGVAGVGVATILSQLLSVVLVFRRMLCTQDVYRLVPRDLRIRKDLLLQVMDLGLPAAVQSCLVATSNLFVQRYLNGFGAAAMAGVGAGRKVDRFLTMISQSFGLSTATFVSQNLGAKQYRRTFSGIRVCLAVNFILLAVIGVPMYRYAPYVIRAFTDSPEALVFGVDMMRVMVPLYFLQMFNQIIPNAVRGFGKSRAVMFLALLGMIGCRQVFLAVVMSRAADIWNIYVCYPLGWGFSALFVSLYYLLAVRPRYLRLARTEEAAKAA